MYEAKARGRSRSQVFDPALARLAADQRLLAADLRAALDADALELHYQPVVDLATDQVVGLEALARWQHATRGAVPPGVFVPLAEAHGFVADLDRWVLHRACTETAATLSTGGLPTGEAVATTAGNLDARWVIHTVGPVYAKSEDRSHLLESAYRESVRVADGLGAKTMAFPAISAGVYGWPVDDAARIAVSTVKTTPTSVDEVRFVLFSRPVYDEFATVLANS